MAHRNQQIFCETVMTKMSYFFTNKKVLDIGSLDINGNNRYLFNDCDYLGIDIGEGPNVDLVAVGHEFEGPDNYYDTIISTECFEHDMHYKKTVKNIIRMLKPGGLFLFTCATTDRPEHGTRRTDEGSAPLLMSKEEWGDYYKNLTEDDIKQIDGFNTVFPDGHFSVNNETHDLYFYGIKNGDDYLKYNNEL